MPQPQNQPEKVEDGLPPLKTILMPIGVIVVGIWLINKVRQEFSQ